MNKVVFFKLIAVVVVITALLIGCAAPTPTPAPAKPSTTAAPPATTAAAPSTTATAAPKPSTTASAPASLTATTAPTTAPVAWSPMLFGSSSSGSAAYALDVAVANALNKYVKSNITVVEAASTLENLRRVNAGEFTIGQGGIDGQWLAFNGAEQFKGAAITGTRSLGATPAYLQAVVVSQSSGITDITGLNGKPYCPGITGSQTEQNNRWVMEALGVTPKWTNMNLTDAAEALKDGRIVGFGQGQPVDYSGGGLRLHLSGATLQASTSLPITIINLTPDQQKKVAARAPWMPWMTLAPGAIYDLPKAAEITSWAMATGWFSTAKLTQAQGYLWIKIVNEHMAELTPSFGALKGFNVPKETISNLMSLQAPRPFLHAGVVQYLKEIGLDVPAALIPPEYKP